MTIFGWHRKLAKSPLHTSSAPRHAGGKNPSAHSTHSELTLMDVPPGRTAQVAGFLSGIPAARQAQLQAYGLVSGAQVRILQHSPVTIVQVEHIELALERGLAGQVKVLAVK
jgi:Fe2+ transport system protein FeoA